MIHMSERRFNWPLWSGLALTLIAFVSYFFVFSKFPITRDVPWANYILFAVAIFLMIAGVLGADRKVFPTIIAVVGVAIFVFFVFAVTIATKQIPAAKGAPHVGQKAPEFALVDTEHHPVALSSLVASSPKGVLLVFYRGYW
jgi:predicted neutral ceramidase superfamily lipid hydrolase